MKGGQTFDLKIKGDGYKTFNVNSKPESFKKKSLVQFLMSEHQKASMQTYNKNPLSA